MEQARLRAAGREAAATIALAAGTLLFTWAVALPVGVYSAVRQYSIGDYVVTFLGFLGIAMPNFLLALVIAYISYKYFGQSVVGLFSPSSWTRSGTWARFSTSWRTSGCPCSCSARQVWPG